MSAKIEYYETYLFPIDPTIQWDLCSHLHLPIELVDEIAQYFNLNPDVLYNGQMIKNLEMIKTKYKNILYYAMSSDGVIKLVPIDKTLSEQQRQDILDVIKISKTI